MTSVRIPITDVEMKAVVQAWVVYEVEYESETVRPDSFSKDMAALTRLQSKWFRAKDAADKKKVK